MLILVWSRQIALGSKDLERVHMKDEYKERVREWVQARLNAGEMVVTFVKGNGRKRVMRCTLQEKLLPSRISTISTKKKLSVDALSVFDLDKQEWRSFTLDRVLEIHVETQNNSGDFVWELAKPL